MFIVTLQVHILLLQFCAFPQEQTYSSHTICSFQKAFASLKSHLYNGIIQWSSPSDKFQIYRDQTCERVNSTWRFLILPQKVTQYTIQVSSDRQQTQDIHKKIIKCLIQNTQLKITKDKKKKLFISKQHGPHLPMSTMTCYYVGTSKV